MLNIALIFKRIGEIKPYKNAVELAVILGSTGQNVRSWKKRGHIPYEFLTSFAQDTGISLDWLILGRGAKYSELLNLTDNAMDKCSDVCSDSLMVINYYEQFETKKEPPTDTLCIPDGLIGCKNEMIGIKVISDNMSPTITKNSIVFVCTENKDIENGNIYVFKIKGELCVSRLFTVPNGIIVKGDNDLYPGYTVEKDSLNIIGQIKGVTQKV